MPKTSQKKLEQVKRWQQNNKERHKQNQKRWREKNPNYMKNYREQNKGKHSERMKEYNQNPQNKKKLRARSRTGYSVKYPLGDKCAECGGATNLERHHPNYDSPTEYFTLCGTCHRRLYGANKG